MDIRKYLIGKFSTPQTSTTTVHTSKERQATCIDLEERGSLPVSDQDEEESPVLLHTKGLTVSCSDEDGSLVSANVAAELPLSLYDQEDATVLLSDNESPGGSSMLCSAPSCIHHDLGDKYKGPSQPKLPKYPSQRYGIRKRSFRYQWFESHCWLEYSVQLNAAFCFACRNFGSRQKRAYVDSLCVEGLKNWKRALESFTKHEKSSSHQSAMLAWADFKESQTSGTIVQRLSSASEMQVKERREYLLRLVSITKFLGRQNIAFRGHYEKEDSVNSGNFIECLQLLKKFDPFLQKYVPPANALYTSPIIQNDFIQCCAEEILTRIIDEVKAAKFYAIMADEARDGRRELLALCIRYVEAKSNVVCEHFLGFTELREFHADQIVESIQNSLKVYGLESERYMCVAQTYDGAAVMSGASGGVQAKFQKYHPEAIYVHCYAHELNLVLCYTCKATQEASHFFEILESLYAFFSTSLVHHHKFQEVQLGLGLQHKELVQISPTRWACQVRSVNALLTNFSAVLQCLSQINLSTARGLSANLRKLTTIFCMFMFQSLLGTTECFHKLLQKPDLDLGKAIDFKEAVCKSLQSMRTIEKTQELYEISLNLCMENDIPVSKVEQRKRHKRIMDDYIVELPNASGNDLNDIEELKNNLLFPCLDRMLSELDKRFSSIQKGLLKGIQACSPHSETFFSDDLHVLAQHYKINLHKEEALVARNYFNSKDLKEKCTISQIYTQLDSQMFPSLHQIVQIALTIPVSSCSCERSFSALRRLHTWLRTTMGHPRLNHLAILGVEKCQLDLVSDENIIDRFAKQRRRVRLL